MLNILANWSGLPRFGFYDIYLLFLAWPDVTIHEINEEWEFLILACDGIWDVMTSQVCYLFDHYL